jgi:hypothetical protein
MNNIMKVFPKGVAEYRDLIVNCLEDEDVTIRIRALDLLAAMVNTCPFLSLSLSLSLSLFLSCRFFYCVNLFFTFLSL